MQLKGIIKGGDRYLRNLLIHAARSAITLTKDRDRPLIRWIETTIARRGFNKAVVALSNKNARIAVYLLLMHIEPHGEGGQCRYHSDA